MKRIDPSKFQDFISSWLQKIDLSKLRETATAKLRAIIPAGLQNLVPDKFRKWLLLGLVLILVVGLACCFHGDDDTEETVLCTVSADSLNVYKKPSADSKVLSQLPTGLEIEILEQTTAGDTDWGRIDSMTLADGSKVKGGWVELQYVRFPGDPDPAATEPMTEPPTEPAAWLPDPDLGTTVMGTVNTGKLNVRSGAGSKYEAVDSYLKGERIEILEIVTVDDTDWGRTGKGWVGMGYVRLDGTPPAEEETDGESDVKKPVSDGSYQILGYGVVDLGELNVRLGPGTEFNKVCEVTKCNRYAYYQVSDNWVRIEDGWVSTDYFYLEGTTADDAVTGIVISDDLNVRTGPSTQFKSNGTIKKGDTVEVLAQVSDWGYTADGWISMTHIELTEPTYTTGSGKVTSGLNIRKEPNADAEIVGTYSRDDSVTVTEVQGSWGKTEKGWINLKYVKYN